MRTLSSTMAWLMMTHFLLGGVMAFVTRGHGSVRPPAELETERGKQVDTVPGAQGSKRAKKIGSKSNGEEKRKKKENNIKGQTVGTDQKQQKEHEEMTLAGEIEKAQDEALEGVPGAALPHDGPRDRAVERTKAALEQALTA